MNDADFSAAIIAKRWYAVVDDVVGGWCVATVDKPTSEINRLNDEWDISFGIMTQELAVHIANAHNGLLTTGPEG